MDSLSLKLCDIQGRLFSLSSSSGYDSKSFVSFFMKAEVAKDLDKPYNRMQWAGEEYLLEETIDESGDMIPRTDKPFDEDIMYWIGYVYRYWHYYKNMESRDIYRISNFETMKRNYYAFHTMAPELAIEDLLEIKRQKEKKG